jgi:hypothetical protein
MPVSFPPLSLRGGVYAALAFFDLFDYPLTIEELRRYVIGVSVDDQSLQEILEHDQRISFQDGYYFLTGMDTDVIERDRRTKIAERYWIRLNRYLPFIRMVPFVKMVAVCNTLAFGSPTTQSDIDLFIVAKRGRIFMVRTFATVLFHLLGVRRHGNKIAGMFCLSFFVADDALDLSPIRTDDHDVYLPFWMATLRLVYGKDIYHEFMAHNEWLKRYFPITPQPHKPWKKGVIFSIIGKFLEFVFGGKMGDRIELMFSQKHHQRHSLRKGELGPQSSVVISDHMLKYHNIDRRSNFTDRFMTIYRRLMN